MKLSQVLIRNYRSCKEVRIDLGAMHALVGANNAGKSTILRALDLLFNPSTTKIDQESFWNCDESLEIWIEGLFTDLTEAELEAFKPYLRPDKTLMIARRIKKKEQEEGEEETKVGIDPLCCKKVPKYEWLREDEIKGEAIDRWWPQRDSLTVNGTSFGAQLGTAKPGVGKWKATAQAFVSEHLKEGDFEDKWVENPQGYAGVLKGSLPQFIFVPAVRDLTDEAKATKTNPFGRLLYAIVGAITGDQKSALSSFLDGIRSKLNRSGGEERIESVVRMETRLNDILKEHMPCELEIEFQPPTLEVLLTTPKLFVDDGFRNVAENKGHGLQRAIIFSILRCYSELLSGATGARTRSVIFGVEEPEIYMHPLAQRGIRRVFRAIAEHGDQIVFSTHSALLLDVAYFDEIIRVEQQITSLDGVKQVTSRVWQLPMQAMIDDVKARHPTVDPTDSAIRELYANAYHPNRAEGFFAAKVILVEGQTEHYALPIYAEAAGKNLDAANVSVVDCGGKGPMDRLYRVFNELGIPCFMVFDFDKDSNDNEILDKSRELLKLGGSPEDPPATPLVTDRLACFPSKWEEQFRSEVGDYDTLVGEARTALGIKSDTGKPLVARYVARQLTKRTPPVVPPTVSSLLGKAVDATWSASCLQKS